MEAVYDAMSISYANASFSGLDNFFAQSSSVLYLITKKSNSTLFDHQSFSNASLVLLQLSHFLKHAILCDSDDLQAIADLNVALSSGCEGILYELDDNFFR